MIPAGAEWWNVTHRNFVSGAFNHSGGGDARFSPLLDAANSPVPVLYVARHPIAALLETVFHEVWVPEIGAGGSRRVRRTDLAGRVLRRVAFNTDVRVLDFSDAELHRHGLERWQMVSTSTEYYDRTRAWADHLLGATVGNKTTAGIGWQSRLVELAHAAVTPLLRTTLVGEQTDVAVVYQLPGGISDSCVTILSATDLDTGPGLGLIVELANAVGAFLDNE